MRQAKVINIVSGKGGTGKTLFSAILAEMLGNKGIHTLVVDMDVFVRGLTALLYFQQGQSLRISQQKEWAVSDFFTKKESLLRGREKPLKLSVHRYRSFDVCPSVPRIDELLNFNDVAPNTRDEALEILRLLLKVIPDEYRYVILDSRAGYDELISATHLVSDLSICVQEDDDISNVTANNLVRQLERDSEILKREEQTESVIFRVINKARHIKTLKDLERYGGFGVTYLGAIPFDMDVMNSFGEKTFWEDISKSLYKTAVARIWNMLSTRMDFKDELLVPRISPFASESFESKFGFITLRNRVVFVYGIILGFLGIIFGIFGTNIVREALYNPVQAFSLAIGVLSLILAFLSVLKGQAK
jgi:septum site-determining protein MinD